MYLLIVTMTKSVDEIEVISEVFTDAVKAKKGSKNKQSGKYHTSYYITIPKDIAKKCFPTEPHAGGSDAGNGIEQTRKKKPFNRSHKDDPDSEDQAA